MDEMFKTIREHWNHFAERDIPGNAPVVQFDAMRKAFAAGAVSGLALAAMASRESNTDARKSGMLRHLAEINELNK